MLARFTLTLLTLMAAASPLTALARPTLIPWAVTVTRCDDNGEPGTLRHLAGNAPAGTVLSLKGLTCPNDTLSLNDEMIIARDLTIRGNATSRPVRFRCGVSTAWAVPVLADYLNDRPRTPPLTPPSMDGKSSGQAPGMGDGMGESVW